MDIGSTKMESWIVEMNEELNNMEITPKNDELQPIEGRKSSIKRIPAYMREKLSNDSHDYLPTKVSFGPYHYGCDSCKQTQQIKKRVVLYSLKRSQKTIDDYVKALSEVAQDLKEAYDDLDPMWEQDDDGFLQLMIYDGCFFLLMIEELCWNNDLENPAFQIDGISRKELIEDYKHDMLLLENQLPMLVLVKLYAIQESYNNFQVALQLLTLRMLVIFCSFSLARKISTTGMHLHVLDLYRHSLVYEEHGGTIITIFNTLLGTLVYPLKFLIDHLKTQSEEEFKFNLPSATNLKDAGFGIILSKTKSLMDISFGRTTLRLPQISVDGGTKSRLLNIIAFEYQNLDVESVVFSCIYLMSGLLKGANDVRILILRGIITQNSTLHHAEDIVELFQSLKDIVRTSARTHIIPYRVPSHYMNVVLKQKESFYKMINQEWQKDLWQNYLRSPWAILSIIAAFLLFTLTTIQTVYTVLSYYNPK